MVGIFTERTPELVEVISFAATRVVAVVLMTPTVGSPPSAVEAEEAEVVVLLIRIGFSTEATDLNRTKMLRMKVE